MITINTQSIIKRLAVSVIFISFSICSQDKIKKAIIVSSYHQEFEVQRNMLQTLRDNLAEKVQTSTLYLDSKRTTEKAVKVKTSQLLQRIKDAAPDVIFLADDNAVIHLAEKLLAQSFNVVILGVNENPRKYINNQIFPSLYGVLERPLYLRAIFELESFYPHATEVTILMDNTVTSNIIKKQVFADEIILRGRITINYKQVETFQELNAFINKINNQPEHQLFVTTLFNLTDQKSAKKKPYSSILNWLNMHYRKPIFSFWKTKVKDHLILAAYGPSEEEQGRAAASMGNDILLGKKFRYRFVTPQNGLFYISQKQLDKFDLKIPNIYLSAESTIYR